MIRKVRNKILGWWICIMGKFTKLSHLKQFSIYSMLFIIPTILVEVFVADRQTVEIGMLIYYIALYLFFRIGLVIVSK